jgi:hypothetical protein
VLCFQLILDISHVLATSFPYVSPVLLVFGCLIYEWLHALTVRALIFLQVHDVKLVSESYYKIKISDYLF